jgi:Spy/CpxP family protein refolding chaperone
MKTKLMALVAGVAAFVMLTGFGPAAGCGRAPNPEERFARAQQMITSRLNDQLDELKATPDQRAKILAIKDRVLQQARGHFEQGAQQRQADRQWAIDQLTSSNPDKAALYAKADAKADELKAISHQVIDALVEVNAVLTPDQRAQLKTKIEQLHARGEHGWGGPGMGY